MSKLPIIPDINDIVSNPFVFTGTSNEAHNSKACNSKACNSKTCNSKTCNSKTCNSKACNSKACNSKACNHDNNEKCCVNTQITFVPEWLEDFDSPIDVFAKYETINKLNDSISRKVYNLQTISTKFYTSIYKNIDTWLDNIYKSDVRACMDFSLTELYLVENEDYILKMYTHIITTIHIKLPNIVDKCVSSPRYHNILKCMLDLNKTNGMFDLIYKLDKMH